MNQLTQIGMKRHKIRLGDVLSQLGVQIEDLEDAEQVIQAAMSFISIHGWSQCSEGSLGRTLFGMGIASEAHIRIQFLLNAQGRLIQIIRMRRKRRLESMASSISNSIQKAEYS